MSQEVPRPEPFAAPAPQVLAEPRPGWRSRVGAVAAGIIGAVC